MKTTFLIFIITLLVESVELSIQTSNAVSSSYKISLYFLGKLDSLAKKERLTSRLVHLCSTIRFKDGKNVKKEECCTSNILIV